MHSPLTRWQQRTTWVCGWSMATSKPRVCSSTFSLNTRSCACSRYFCQSNSCTHYHMQSHTGWHFISSANLHPDSGVAYFMSRMRWGKTPYQGGQRVKFLTYTIFHLDFPFLAHTFLIYYIYVLQSFIDVSNILFKLWLFIFGNKDLY